MHQNFLEMLKIIDYFRKLSLVLVNQCLRIEKMSARHTCHTGTRVISHVLIKVRSVVKLHLVVAIIL
jgi:hypothetical protein